LAGADLTGAKLVRVNLCRADLTEANLRGDLSYANLSYAKVANANLTEANLTDARLNGADLKGAILNRATMRGIQLGDAVFGFTVLADVDLSEASGLDSVEHTGPSSIGLDTLYKSQGRIPDTFLRGAGVPEEVIEHLLPLIRQSQQI
jgi:uncharacterized protein YjbI with pentapeptide repeats